MSTLPPHVEPSTDVESVAPTETGALHLQAVQLVFKNVNIDVKTTTKENKRILNNVSGRFGPGELTAIMGPSGSGKTTMLNALTGKITPTSGKIEVNGKPFNSTILKSVMALVPQDDLLTPALTCSEALMEAAALKTDLTTSQAYERTVKLLDTVGLTECKNVTIGHPEGQKGLSGGQKKRLSVALELMGNPSLLYLDEPTSGLDSVSALSLIKLLARLARQGATIITTIHQPSAAAFFSFDRLLVLAKGTVCYDGPISITQPVDFLKSSGYVCPEFHNPADFIMEVLTEQTAQKAMQEQLATTQPSHKLADVSVAPIQIRSSASLFTYFKQFKTLLQRNFRVMIREPGLAKSRIASNVIMGVVIGVLYLDLGKGSADIAERIALLLFTLIFMMLISVLPTILTVLPELAVMKKEYSNNWYSLRSFFAAKQVADSPLLAIPPLLYTLIMSFLTGLHDNSAERFLHLYVAIFISCFVAQSFATAISCAAPNLPVAIVAVPISILPMLLFAGFFKNVAEITWAFRWISYISFFRYAWEALNIAAFQELPLEIASPVPGVNMTGNSVLTNRLQFETTSSYIDLYWRNVGIIMAYGVGLRLIAYLALLRRVKY